MDRTFSSRSIGLVLAGGGARGAYQIGVWQALRDAHVPIEAVAGVSIGAINGALICLDAFDVAWEQWHQVRPQDLFKLPEALPFPDNIFDHRNLRLLTRLAIQERGLDTTPLRHLLQKYLDEEKIRRSPVHYGLLTYNLSERRPLPLFIEAIPQGQLIDYIMASACLPIFQAVHIDGQRYIDGAMYNIKPTTMLLAAGCRHIVEVEIGGFGVVRRYNHNLADVITIKPGHSLGGTLEIKANQVDTNIELGYHDARRILAAWPQTAEYF